MLLASMPLSLATRPPSLLPDPSILCLVNISPILTSQVLITDQLKSRMKYWHEKAETGSLIGSWLSTRRDLSKNIHDLVKLCMTAAQKHLSDRAR